MANGDIIQLSPEDLRPAAEFAQKFPGVNAAQRVRYANDRAQYAQALQQQQAEHQAQKIMTDKDANQIYINQRNLEMRQQFHEAQMQHLQLSNEALFAKKNTELMTRNAQQSQDAEQNLQTGNMINAINQSFAANKANPKAHFTSVNPGDYPFVDPANPVINDYMKNRDKYLAPSQQGSDVVPPSILARYARTQGAIGYHQAASTAEATKNTADQKANVPYSQTADWVMQNNEAAVLERQYPQLKTLAAPQPVQDVAAPTTTPVPAPTVAPVAVPAQTTAPVASSEPTPHPMESKVVRNKQTGQMGIIANGQFVPNETQ